MADPSCGLEEGVNGLLLGELRLAPAAGIETSVVIGQVDSGWWIDGPAAPRTATQGWHKQQSCLVPQLTIVESKNKIFRLKLWKHRLVR